MDLGHFLPDHSLLLIFQHQFLLAVSQLLDFLHRKWKCLWKQALKDLDALKYFYISGKFLSKASIVSSISCHVMVNVCLHPFGKIRSSKDAFLNIFWWYVTIVSNMLPFHRNQTLKSYWRYRPNSCRNSHVASREIFQSAFFSFFIKFSIGVE